MNNPLVIITSRAHVPRMRAHKILLEQGYDNWLMAVDNEEQMDRAVNEAGVPVEKMVIVNTPNDIPKQDRIAFVRQRIEEGLVKPGRWYVSLDDNVAGWTALPYPWYDAPRHDFDESPNDLKERTWRQLYDVECPFPVVVEHWKELINECEARGTLAGGFAIETNYFFRGTKWQRLGYVRAQNAVWKNTGLPFYYWRGAMLEDFCRTVDVVSRCGSVCINRYVKPQKKFFEEGGIGTFEERRPNLVACSDELLRRYPGLLRRNKGQDYQLTFAVRSPEGVQRWQRERGIA